MKYPRSLLASAIILALSAQANSQEATQELDLSVVESDSIERDAVVDVLTADDIEIQQADDFEELVRYTPGVSVSKGDDRWGSSGFNIRGLDEDRVAINVDGIPQGETLKYEGGQAYGYFKGSRNGVDLEALKEVEIVKGADSLFSGSGALSGAVNFTTKDPDDFLADVGDDTGGSVKVEHSGANNEVMMSFAIANRTGALESLLIYTNRDGHEYRNFDMDGLNGEGSTREVPDPRDAESDNILAKLIYHISPNQKIGFTGSTYESNGITDTQSFNGGWYSNRIGDDVRETTRFGIFHELTADTALFDTIETHINSQEIKFTANTIQRFTLSFGGPILQDENRVDSRSFDQELLQLTVDLEKSFADSHKLIYGLEFQNKDYVNVESRVADSFLNDLGPVTTNTFALIPKSEAEITTFYAQDSFDAGDSTQLRIGARYDGYSYDATSNEDFTDGTGTFGEISFSAITWTLGVEQALSDSLSLEAGVSTGFRAPTIEEMFQTSGDLDDWNTIANPDLEAEEGTNFDIALTGTTESGFYRVGVFFSKYDNFIDYESRTGINTNTGLEDPDGFDLPVNANDVDMKGVELSMYLDLNQAFGMSQGLTTHIQAAYTDGENGNGDPVYSVQPYSLSWILSYIDPNGNWGVNLYTTHTSGKKDGDSYFTEDDGSRTYPLYLSNTATVIDVTTFYELSSNFKLTAGIYNLTDKEYYNWDSVRFVDQGDLRPGIGVTDDGIKRYSEPGRYFELGLKYEF